MIYTASMFQKGSMKLQKEELRHVLLKHCLEPVCRMSHQIVVQGIPIMDGFSTLNIYHSLYI